MIVGYHYCRQSPLRASRRRFDEGGEVLKDRLLRGSGTGSINTPLDGRRRQDVEYLFNNLAAIEGPKQVVLIHGPTREGDFSVRPSDLVGLDGLASAPFFERFEREQVGGYVLAFEPASADRDGRAHEIRVTVTNHPRTTVRTRHEFAVPAPPPTVE